MKIFFVLSCIWLSGYSLSAQTDTLKKFADGNYLVRSNRVTHFVSGSGDELGSWTETIQNIKQWNKQMSIVRKTDSLGNKKTGVFDQLEGAFILPMEYDQVSRLDDLKGFYETRLGKKYGLFIASTGKIMPSVYNDISRHLDPNWVIACTATCGYVFDDQLVMVDSIPGMKSVHSRIINGNNQWLHVNMVGYQGLLNKENKLISNKEWEHVHDVKGSLAIVKSDKGIGVFDMATGKMVKPYFYTDFFRDVEDEGFKTEFSDDKEFVSSKDGFKGFTTDSYGELAKISDLYDKCCYFQLLKIQGRSYLILSKNGYFGIIDSSGNVLKGFDFIHKKIARNHYANDKASVWFFVTRDGQTWSLQNDKGEIRYADQIPNGSKQSPYTKGKFGIVVFSNNSDSQPISGLFDCFEMKWVIKPQNNFNIVNVDYSSKETLDTENPLNRARAEIYFCIKEGSNDYYYSDLSGRIYRMPGL